MTTRLYVHGAFYSETKGAPSDQNGGRKSPRGCSSFHTSPNAATASCLDGWMPGFLLPTCQREASQALDDDPDLPHCPGELMKRRRWSFPRHFRRMGPELRTPPPQALGRLILSVPFCKVQDNTAWIFSWGWEMELGQTTHHELEVPSASSFPPFPLPPAGHRQHACIFKLPWQVSGWGGILRLPTGQPEQAL